MTTKSDKRKDLIGILSLTFVLIQKLQKIKPVTKILKLEQINLNSKNSRIFLYSIKLHDIAALRIYNFQVQTVLNF